MLKCDRERIRKNFVVLISETPCSEVVSYLYQDGVFSEQVVNEILDEPFSKRNFTLLYMLQRRGPKAFPSFIEALKQAKRQDLVNALTEFEKNFSKLSI